MKKHRQIIITEKQERVFNEIFSNKGITLREIKENLQYGNTSSVQRHTDVLVKKGIIKNTRKGFEVKDSSRYGLLTSLSIKRTIFSSWKPPGFGKEFNYKRFTTFETKDTLTP